MLDAPQPCDHPWAPLARLLPVQAQVLATRMQSAERQRLKYRVEIRSDAVAVAKQLYSEGGLPAFWTCVRCPTHPQHPPAQTCILLLHTGLKPSLMCSHVHTRCHGPPA